MTNDESRIIRCMLSKQLGTAYALTTRHGTMPLDDELRQVIDSALRPVLEKRLLTVVDTN